MIATTTRQILIIWDTMERTESVSSVTIMITLLYRIEAEIITTSQRDKPIAWEIITMIAIT